MGCPGASCLWFFGFVDRTVIVLQDNLVCDQSSENLVKNDHIVVSLHSVRTLHQHFLTVTAIHSPKHYRSLVCALRNYTRRIKTLAVPSPHSYCIIRRQSKLHLICENVLFSVCDSSSLALVVLSSPPGSVVERSFGSIVFATDLPLMPYLCRSRRIVFADTSFLVEKKFHVTPFLRYRIHFFGIFRKPRRPRRPRRLPHCERWKDLKNSMCPAFCSHSVPIGCLVLSIR